MSDGLAHLYSSSHITPAYYHQQQQQQQHHRATSLPTAPAQTLPHYTPSYGNTHHHHHQLHPHHHYQNHHHHHHHLPHAGGPAPLTVPIPVPVYLRGKSPAVSPAEAARAAKKCRRSRTVFTELQLMGLEKRFEKQKYLSTPDRLELAETLGLSQLQVKTWYQNRRMKWKKQVMQSGRQDSPTKPKGRPKKNDVTDENDTTSHDPDHEDMSDISDGEELPPVSDVPVPSRFGTRDDNMSSPLPLTSFAYSSPSLSFQPSSMTT